MPTSLQPNHPDAQAIEAWLTGLRNEGTDEGDGIDEPGHRTLFILDNDFGELTTIMYLVLGQACFRDARILASPRLHATNHDALPGRVALWDNEKDLVAAIDSFRPNVIVLASGYLLPIHGLLNAAAIDRLCARARRDGVIVATADPFLGLLSIWSGAGLDRLISIDIPKSADAPLVAAKKTADTLLHTILADAERVLRTAPHLYPSFADMDGLAPHETDIRNLSFFNEKLLIPPHLPSAGDDDRPYWMFLISLVDFERQSLSEGALIFARIVAARLTDAVTSGRRAILLAPIELIQWVSRVLPTDDRIELLAFCPFARAMSLLLAAEHCFYWNLVSHSILMQLWNGRSVILFDSGHLVRAVPAIHERVIAWYYQGQEPPYLDHKATLSPAIAAEAAAGDAERRAGSLPRYRRAPSPAAMLESLLGSSQLLGTCG
ncbi:MAG TPA: hypothetical protein VMS43_09240 [Allosphingosinicella sp.]|nr:hypothetical protein [Allosphingosinicella sp.]